MSELKPCPFCGEDATMQAPNMHRKTCISCKECGMSTGWGSVEAVTAAWNRRAQPDHIVGANKMIPDNAPLTLEELRGMVGSPVWVTHSDGSGGRWGIVNSYNHGLCADVGSGMAYWFDDYIGNVAYRRKPEGGDHDA